MIFNIYYPFSAGNIDTRSCEPLPPVQRRGRFSPQDNADLPESLGMAPRSPKVNVKWIEIIWNPWLLDFSMISGSLNWLKTWVFHLFSWSKIDPDWANHSWGCKDMWTSDLRASRKSHSQRKPKCSLQPRRLWTDVTTLSPSHQRTPWKVINHSFFAALSQHKLIEPISIWFLGSQFLPVIPPFWQIRTPLFRAKSLVLHDEPLQDQRFPCKQTIEKPGYWLQQKHHTPSVSAMF